MDTGEHFKNNADYESQISDIFGHMRTRKDPLIMALNQRVLGSSPSASTKTSNKIKVLWKSAARRIFQFWGLRYSLRYKFDVMRGSVRFQIIFRCDAL